MPCSGYFLAMPPRVYVKQKREFPRDPVAAVDGVTLTFSGPADEGRRAGWNTMVDGEGGRDGVIDLIHTPPVCELDAFAAAVEALAEPGGPAENVVLLAGDAEGAGAAWKKIQPIVGMGAGKHTILLGKRRRENAQYPTTLANWRRSLSDRLPCVIRDPNSHLSQSYLGICNTIITSRGNHAPAALSRTAAAQTR
jgi:hypothetical protein